MSKLAKNLLVAGLLVWYLPVAAQDNYRTIASGLWSATTVWEKDVAGNGVFASTATPPTASNSLSIQIRNGHTVRINAAASVDSLTIQSGGTLNIAPSFVLTIVDGTGIDMMVLGTLNDSGTVTLSGVAPTMRVGGILNNSGTFTGASSSSLFFDAGSIYDHRFTTTAGTIPSATWNTTSTCRLASYTTNLSAPSGLSQPFGNFTFDCPNLNLGGSYFPLGGLLTTIQGNLTIGTTGAADGLSFKNTTGTTNITVGGDIIFNSTIGSYVTFNESATGTCNISCRNFSISNALNTLSIADAGIAVLSVSGNFTATAGTVNHSSGNSSTGVSFNGTATQNYTSGAVIDINYFVQSNAILSLSGSNALIGTGNLTVNNGARLILGSTSSAGALQANNQAGSNIRCTGTRTFAAGSVVVFGGTAAQTIGNGVLPNMSVEINNPNGVSLNTNTNIGQVLRMVNGTINLNGFNLTVGTSATNTGSLAYTSGIITGNGLFTRWFGTSNISMPSDSGLFPLGNTGDTAFVWIAGAATVGGSISVSPSFVSGITNYATPFTDGGISVVRRYNLNWTINSTGLSGSNFSLRIGRRNATGITDVSALRIALVSGVAPGTSQNGSGTTANAFANRTALSASQLSQTFYMASGTANALPVKWISLNAQSLADSRILNWAVAAEENNSHFEIEHSTDGENYMMIGKVQGAGNNATINHYQFIQKEVDFTQQSFYRIRQVDFDGMSGVSEVLVVYPEKVSKHMLAYPNPSFGAENINIQLPNPAEEFTYEIKDMTGKLLLSGKGQALNISNLPDGMYMLSVINKNIISQTKFIKN